MQKKIIIAIASTMLLVACGRNKDTESVTTHDSTAVADHTSVASAEDTSQPHTSHGQPASMMAIMDKSMQDMKAMRSTGDPDIDFAATMKLHHMSAIEASQLVLQQGTDTLIKSMAQKMLQDQQEEVAAFDAFIAANKSTSSDSSFFTKSMRAMDKMTMNMDHSGSLERQFVVMMIPHHQGAIDMSQLYLQSGKNGEMKKIANDIIKSQRKEINDLKSWLAKNK